MATYPTTQPFPIQNGKPISGLTEDIENYIIDNTEGNITAPEIHNIFKNVIYSIPLSGSTNFDINFLQNYDMLRYEGGKWVNSYDYYRRSEVYNTGQTYSKSEVYNTNETYSKTEVYNTGETYSKTEVLDLTGFTNYYTSGQTITLIENTISGLTLSGLSDTIINNPQSGTTIGSPPYDKYDTYDSLFYSGGTWQNKKAYIAEDIIDMVDEIASSVSAVTISGETIERYIRSQFEGNVHVNQSGQTQYPDSDGFGDLFLWTDGESGMTWQPSIFWVGQYSQGAYTSGITHMGINFSGVTQGAGDMVVYLNLDGIGNDPQEIVRFTKDENFIFGNTNIIDSSTLSSINGGQNNEISDNSFYSFIGGGELNELKTSRSFIGAGKSNELRSSYSFIGAGIDNNLITSENSFIGSGELNLIDNFSRWCLIGGGKLNLINYYSDYSFIGGGESNKIYDNNLIGFGNGSTHSFIGSGSGNTIFDSKYSFIGAGLGNNISGSTHAAITSGEGLQLTGNSHATAIGKFNYSGRTAGDDVLFVIGNGTSNSNRSDALVVTSGNSSVYINNKLYVNNDVEVNDNIFINGYIKGVNSGLTVGETNINNPSNNLYSSISGGDNNQIEESPYSFIGSGYDNYIDISLYSFIGAGYDNYIKQLSSYSFIGGGKNNEINYSKYSFIGSGDNNTIKSTGGSIKNNSIVGGYNNNIENCNESTILGGYKIELSGQSNVTACGYFNDLGRSSGDNVLFVVGNGNSSTRDDAFHVDIYGNAYASGSLLSFTGAHTYLTNDTGITIGDSVMLSGDTAYITNNSGLTNCAGIVSSIKNLNDTNISNIDLFEFFSGKTYDLTGSTSGETNYWFLINVAALGDSRCKFLRGFKVCDEGGNIKNGDLLQTSSTPGYLMKQEDDIIRSKTVGKSMENVVFDGDGKAKGIYGYLYCG